MRQTIVPYPVYEPYPVYQEPYPVYRPLARLAPRCVIQKRWVKTKRGWRKVNRRVCYRR